MEFSLCLAITIISAVVSLGFSIAAVRIEKGRAYTMALYGCVRCVALVAAAIVPVFTGSVAWLQAVSTAMIIVQAGDAVVGRTIGSPVKTYGPAATAIANLAATIWLVA